MSSAAGAAPERAVPVPRTLARRIRPFTGGARVTSAPFALSHLVLTWAGGRQPAIRTRSASGWSDWRAVHASHEGKDGKARRAPQQSALLTVPGTLGYEVDYHGRGANVSVTELNTVEATAPRRGAATMPILAIGGYKTPVRYLKRASWGANESWRFTNGTESWPPEYSPVQTVTVHHTAGANNDPDPAATVRAIYYYDAITQEWGDMGYHFLIDEAGTVYEGRWSGTDTEPAFAPTGPYRPQVATGGHALNCNTGNIGVVLLGDFTSQLPTAAARRALTQVLALLARVGGLNPLGTTNYQNPVNGYTKQVPTIAAHREFNATQCPGNLFYPQLPSVRQDVNTLLLS